MSTVLIDGNLTIKDLSEITFRRTERPAGKWQSFFDAARPHIEAGKAVAVPVERTEQAAPLRDIARAADLKISLLTDESGQIWLTRRWIPNPA